MEEGVGDGVGGRGGAQYDTDIPPAVNFAGTVI